MAPYSPAYRSSVLIALTTATEHLSVVADYVFVPEPGTFVLLIVGGCLAGLGLGRLRG
jgi:PEP-CTERM motif